MRLALSQYALSDDMDENLLATTGHIRTAADQGADLIAFPELCLSPFFPQHPGRDASQYLLDIDSPSIRVLQETCRERGLFAVPNVYLAEHGASFDASLVIDPTGEIRGTSKMVHIAQAPGFYEQDYYTPSDTGFPVYDTPFGCIGNVVCFDRHFPESIRTCVLAGAQLILIPTANTTAEPRDLFEWEVRVAARQNGIWIAMCNRVGAEGEVVFCGESIIVDPEGGVAAKAGGGAELLLCDIDLSMTRTAWQREIYIERLRPDSYWSARPSHD